MTELILIYCGLFAVVWIVFKLSNRNSSPFKSIFFWTTLLLTSAGVTVFIFYWFIRNFFGAPPEDGWNRRYHENGKVQTEFFATDGKIEGYFKSYYSNGQLEFLSKYKNGTQVDTSYAYYESGKIQSFQVFQEDKSIYEIHYSPNGNKKSERYNPIDSLNENYNVTYYANGEKEFETRIDNKEHEGPGFYYYANGKVKYKGQYKEGRKNGVWLQIDSLTGTIVDRDTFDFKNDRQFKKDW